MNPIDQLEVELGGMRPVGASAELKRRIVERLDHASPTPAHRTWGIALAGALAAACLAAIALWRNDLLRSPNEVAGPHAGSAVEAGDLGPTVLAYRHALVSSPERFSQLLDKHAEALLPHDPARNGIRAFVRPNSEHLSWTGEL